MCRQIKYKNRFVSQVDLKGNGLKFRGWSKPYWDKSSVKVLVYEYCPKEEPIMERRSSCETLEAKFLKI